MKKKTLSPEEKRVRREQAKIKKATKEKNREVNPMISVKGSVDKEEAKKCRQHESNFRLKKRKEARKQELQKLREQAPAKAAARKKAYEEERILREAEEIERFRRHNKIPANINIIKDRKTGTFSMSTVKAPKNTDQKPST